MYFSGKQTLYDYKIKLCVSPSRLTISCTAKQPGSVADLNSSRADDSFNKEATGKILRDLEYDENRVLQQYRSDYCADTNNKRYQKPTKDLSVVQPVLFSVQELVKAAKVGEK